MKQLLVLVAACFLMTTGKANTLQTDTIGKQRQLVKVNEWGSRALILLGGYFDETKDEIIKQTGEALFNDIEAKCSSGAWPNAFNDMSSDEAVVNEKMNKLIMYKVAAYTHKYNGNTFDRYVILEVPHAGNELWDETAIWEGSVYFIIKEKDVELVP